VELSAKSVAVGHAGHHRDRLDEDARSRDDSSTVPANATIPDDSTAQSSNPREDAHPADADVLFIAFVQHRDMRCPRCDYSLRNAASAVCPECGEPLRLAVEPHRSIMTAFLTTVAPGLGCGVSSLIFGFLIVAHPGAPAQIVFATAIMFLSGLVALGVIHWRMRFLRMPRETQRAIAAVSVAVHVVLVILLAISFD
jgi:hypothetical protein